MGGAMGGATSGAERRDERRDRQSVAMCDEGSGGRRDERSEVWERTKSVAATNSEQRCGGWWRGGKRRDAMSGTSTGVGAMVGAAAGGGAAKERCGGVRRLGGRRGDKRWRGEGRGGERRCDDVLKAV